jgi:hypothetical protein
MKLFSLLCIAVVVSHCKTTRQSENHRSMRLEKNNEVVEPHSRGEDAIQSAKDDGILVIARDSIEETAVAVETEQAVTAKEVQGAPVIPKDEGEVDAPPVMVPEIGSQCKAPVSAGCLGISSVMTEEKEGSTALGKALRKYGRLITPAMHACNYYERNLTRYPNISYFTDLVVYWSEASNKITYWAFPANFIFSAGCSFDEDFKNPFLADLKATQSWDGMTSIKSLGYSFGSNLPVPATFAADLQKSEKITQETHRCSWAVRPMIYAFPDGVIYRFVGGNTINIYTFNKAIAQGCYLPKKLSDAATNYGLVCGRIAMNPDPSTRFTLAQLGLLPETGVNRVLDGNLLNSIETNGKPVTRASFKCTYVSRNRILQFSDGFAFIDDDCTNVNLITNQVVKDRGCVIP